MTTEATKTGWERRRFERWIEITLGKADPFQGTALEQLEHDVPTPTWLDPKRDR